MFATVTRSRSFRPNTNQMEEKPEPGTDSTYGVRSFTSSEGDGDSDEVEGEGEDIQQDLSEALKDATDQEDTRISIDQPNGRRLEESPFLTDSKKDHDSNIVKSSPLSDDNSSSPSSNSENEIVSPTTSTSTITQEEQTKKVHHDAPLHYQSTSTSQSQYQSQSPIIPQFNEPPMTPPPPPSPHIHIPLSSTHLASLTRTHHNHQIQTQNSPPSSPASLASIPSYVASISSVSRTSSPGFSLSSNGDFPRSSHDHDHESVSGSDWGYNSEYLSNRNTGTDAGTAFGPGIGTGSEELVLPMLNLPSSSLPSLIVPLPRYEGPSCKTIKIVIMASNEEKTRRFISCLRDEMELVQMNKSEIGVIRCGKVVAVLITGLKMDSIENRVENAYNTLHGMLHPSPSREAQSQIAGLVESHGCQSGSEWIHLVLALDAEPSAVRTLAHVVPTLSIRPVDGAALYQLKTDNNDESPTASRAGTPSPPNISEPTPKVSTDGSSYFASRRRASTTHRSDSQIAIDYLNSVLDDIPSLKSSSTIKFFTWRPQALTSALDSNIKQDLTASQSSHDSSVSPASASSFDAAPMQIMPTVARAQGGGEWEANLSRRMAKRREIEGNTVNSSSSTLERGNKRGRGRRRISNSKETNHSTRDSIDKSCGPLFPIIPKGSNSSLISNVGLRDLADKVFSTFGMKSKRWRWVAVGAVTAAAAAVLVAVGWGWAQKTW